jgi:hypothetical protein
MAERQTTARKQRRSARDQERPEPDRDAGGNGGAVDEDQLRRYLEKRIKPGLNRGSIPLLARSIAHEIAREESDLEADLHRLQERLGSDWVLYFAVHDGESWLTAETEDATQRLEAPDASVLVKAVELINEGGGRPR